MKKVNEIFYSLQGEGYYTGTAAVFIRFCGCNLRCDFCDTSFEEGEWMSDEEIAKEIDRYPARHIVLTGGEPGLSVTPDFIRLLKSLGKYIQIETNGTCALPEGIDWITCSPKPGGRVVITRPHELKVVYLEQDPEQYDFIEAQEYYLQPCSGQNTEAVIEYIKSHPKWKLSLQTHKYLNIR